MSSEGLAPWRRHIEKHFATSAGDVAARFASLATVRSDGSPAVRTVVFRGFAPETDSLLITTDLRSPKVKEMQARPQVELCWYSVPLRVQWRIAGAVRLCGVSSDPSHSRWEDLRTELWKSISEDARKHFTWPAPGEFLANPAAFHSSTPSNEIPLDSFLLLVLDPQTVDQLELLESPHRRILFARGGDGTWTERRLNP